jgi:preprotein translocase subunit SecB
MTEKAPDTTDRLRLANAVVRRVQILDVRLVGSKLKCNIASDAVLPAAVQLKYGFKVGHRYQPETQRLGVLVTFLVTAREGDGKDESDIFAVEAAFALEYGISGDESVHPAEVAAFAKLNGLYNAWPYWREYVQSTVSRMGLPPVVLPVLTAGTIEKMVREDEEQAGSKDSEPVVE